MPASAGSPWLVRVAPDGQPLDIEVQWVGPADPAAPVLVFLHEGLGSVAMWRDFPARLCEAAGARGLVYSRPGYGRSTPRAPHERWTPRFMHRQAHEVLPALLEAVGIDAQREPPWLFGHSDGGSIALLHAAAFPDALRGAIVLAPHILVEDISVASIRQARETYLGTDLKQRLARHHADPDSAFWGWNDIWLDPAFRNWSIEAEIEAIRCPVLAIQGVDDEYGTLEQVRGIARRVPQTQVLELAACGHSPHRDQPQAVIEATTRFLRAHGASRPRAAAL
jgi:pimeloyl-ACP methyl ester carboxylesterase